MMVTDDWKPGLKSGLILRSVGNASLLIDPESREWAVLDPIATAIVGQCDGKTTVADIADRLTSRQGSIIVKAFRRTIEALSERGFVDTSRQDFSPRHCCDGPTSLHLEITNSCNLKCSHCYVSAGKRLANELRLDEIERIIDQFTDICVESERGVIAITGGEARLRGDCLEILRYARRSGYATRLFTDAVGFPLEFGKAIADLGVSVQVSLDGVDATSNDPLRGRGTFERIVRGIDMLIEAGLGSDMILFTTLSRATIDRALDMLDFAEARGIPYLHFSQMNPQGRAAPSWGTLAPTTEQWIRFGETLLARRSSATTQIKGNAFGGLDMSSRVLFPKMNCEIPSAIRIDCTGNVYPCQLFVEPEHRVGNVRDQSLAAILLSDMMGAAKAACAGRGAHIEKCKVCPWEAVCGSGCPAHAYSEFGTVNHEDSLCDVRIHWFEATAQAIVEERSLGTPVPICID